MFQVQRSENHDQWLAVSGRQACPYRPPRTLEASAATGQWRLVLLTTNY
jgi:hypothetical protein